MMRAPERLTLRAMRAEARLRRAGVVKYNKRFRPPNGLASPARRNRAGWQFPREEEVLDGKTVGGKTVGAVNNWVEELATVELQTDIRLMNPKY
jgi:hypothetical protein